MFSFESTIFGYTSKCLIIYRCTTTSGNLFSCGVTRLIITISSVNGEGVCKIFVKLVWLFHLKSLL